MSAESQYRFPPGPETNLLWSALRRLRPANPLKLFPHLAEKYGDAVHYQVGSNHFVLLSHPDYVREILIVQQDNFIKERTMQRSRMLLGEGMLTAEGALHRQQRQAAQPAFHRRQIPEYAETMVSRAAALSHHWQDGICIDVSREMMVLTFGIVAKTLFGTEIDEEVQELADAINSIMALYNFLVLTPAVELLVHLLLPMTKRFAQARDRLDATVYRMIQSHRAKVQCAAESLTVESRLGEKNGDLLSMMLADNPTSSVQRDRQLRDEVITIFLAGYETVANALAWTWYLLSQNPDAAWRLHEEIDSVLGGRLPTSEDVQKLKYTDMVFSESMRLFPPTWTMGRKALDDFHLGPFFLPAGTTVLISQWVMHRDARYFSDPLRFQPERFAPESKREHLRFSYFPFGAGLRQCIGESFARMEGVLLLATLAQSRKLRLVPDHQVEPAPLITLRPKYGMQMHIERRHASHCESLSF